MQLNFILLLQEYCNFSYRAEAGGLMGGISYAFFTLKLSSGCDQSTESTVGGDNPRSLY